VLQHAMSLVGRVPSRRRTPLEIQILERIGDAHFALGAMVESALAYETESALASRAGLIAARVQAQTCLARSLGVLDPNRAIAVRRDGANDSIAVEDSVVQARVALLAAATRLLYDGWSTNDARVCETADQAMLRAGETATARFDRMLYAHVQ